MDDRPDSTPQPPIEAQECVYTHPGPVLACLQCQAPLRAPKLKNRPPKFCPGNRCRSRWHQELKRKLIAEIDGQLADIRTRLAEVDRLLKGLL